MAAVPLLSSQLTNPEDATRTIHQYESGEHEQPWGYSIHELRDDTLNYACTIRDWGDRFEANRKALAEAFGEPTVRAFLLFLRGSWQWLRENQTQAYHLVAGLSPALPGAIHSSAGAGARGPASGS